MIPLLQTKTADTAHTGILQVTPGPFPDFWVGPGDEANIFVLRSCNFLGQSPMTIVHAQNLFHSNDKIL